MKGKHMLYHGEDDERTELIVSDHHNIDVGYKTYPSLGLVTSWRHWLIGPVVVAYIFTISLASFALVEYTKQHFKDLEFDRANITVDDNTSDACHVPEDDLVYKTETKATSEASTWNVYYAVAAGVPAIFANLFLGSYTDSIGRKFLFLTCIVGSFLRLSMTSVIIYFDAKLSFLLLASFIEGCTGMYATILQVSSAYMADITKPGKGRIAGVIYIELSIAIGITVATTVNGFVIQWLGYPVTFASTAGILLLNFIAVIFFLPETMTKDRRSKHTSCMSVVKKSISFFIDNDSENRRWKFRLILIIYALCNMSFMARSQTETLYLMAPPFCWSITKIGVFIGIKVVVVIIIGFGSVRLFQKCLDEVWICMIGCASYGAAFLWTAFVEDDISLYIIMVVGCFGPLSTTMQRSMLSHLTPAEKQGAIYSTIGSIEVVTSLLAHVMTSSIYAASVDIMRGLAFIVLASFDVVCIVLLLILKVGWRQEKRSRGYQRIPSVTNTEILVPEP